MSPAPSSLLFARIKAELVSNGTPFADAAAEVAFRSWFQSALSDSGRTSSVSVLFQPNTSTAFSVGVRVGYAGNKVNVWWGDGATDSYSPSTDSNTTVAHTYGSAAKRPIVIIGRITRWEGPAQAYGGRLWEQLRALESVTCWGSANISSRICSLPERVAYLNCGDCTGLTGNIGNLPDSLEELLCYSCSQLQGDIGAAPESLTTLGASGCPLIGGNLANAPAGLVQLNGGDCGFTYATTPRTRSWAPNMQRVYLTPSTPGTFTSAMADALLIDLAETTWTGAMVLDIRGNCGAPTVAADEAISALIDAGVTVLTN